MLQFRDLSLRRGPKLLFEHASFNVHAGWKLGITGANGAGKSSLFALILGQLHADAGELDQPGSWVIAQVAQQTPSGSRPAIEHVLDGDAELRRVQAGLAAAEAAQDGGGAAHLHGLLEAIGGYEARSRAARLLHGLGFRPGQEGLPIDHFSGGWRMRLNLARALMARSDLLLLDEPTNHLDLDAVIWLEQWLRRYPGTLLLISHDREFMDAVVDHLVHIDQQRADLYAGNYSAFERIRAERLAHLQAEHNRQQREIAHMHAFVERFRAKATKARQAQSRLKALARMEQIVPAHVDSPFHFAFPQPDRLPNPLLRLDEASAGYAGSAVIEGLELSLSPGDRVGLLGPNGAGKSTLIKLLAGGMQPLSGRIERAADLAVGYFAQHQLDQLHSGHTPLEHLLQVAPRATEQSLRDFLGGFGFAGDRALEPVAPFSGGEKARLALALLVYRRPNLLLLDEPTNHLDLEMRHALGQALLEFEGAMVIVSHDRHLLRITSDRLLLVNAGRVEEFRDSLDEYPRWLASRSTPEPVPSERADAAHTAGMRKERKRAEAERRRGLQPLKRRLTELRIGAGATGRRAVLDGGPARRGDPVHGGAQGRAQGPACVQVPDRSRPRRGRDRLAERLRGAGGRRAGRLKTGPAPRVPGDPVPVARDQGHARQSTLRKQDPPRGRPASSGGPVTTGVGFSMATFGTDTWTALALDKIARSRVPMRCCPPDQGRWRCSEAGSGYTSPGALRRPSCKRHSPVCTICCSMAPDEGPEQPRAPLRCSPGGSRQAPAARAVAGAPHRCALASGGPQLA